MIKLKNMKKIILSAFVLLLVGMSSLAYAYMGQIQGDEDNIVYTASAFQGWNILNAGSIVFNKLALTANSDIKAEDIKAVFYYSPSQKTYIQIYPNFDDTKFTKEERYYGAYSAAEISSASAWVYVERDGMIEYTTDDVISMTKRKLTSGWNFVSVTQKGLGSSLNDLKGSCDIQKAYYYFEEYKQLDLNMKLPSDMASHGLLIKVTNDCQFSGAGSSVTPPQIPN